MESIGSDLAPVRGAVSRRRVLAMGTGALAVATAGCTRLSELVVDRIVGDVNVFNTTDEPVTGSLTLTDPSGETLLDTELDLTPDGDDGIYEDTLTTAGTYAISVLFETDDGSASGGDSRTIEVSDPDEEHVVVFLGQTYTDQPVTIEVVEDFAELEGTIEGDGRS
ncbi:hypothetical protein Halru_0579 [Halovivax ruber XH-70]|uniref:Uncharacterized protein n=1 Tax=Halovivax ruber (strain DSM 18193 / JCM 13892 / XH-70) TaxID=797302 RepID=L0IB83_HALRX|nr:hypothetical protein [Halovivax ruber]AGB15212.1 hypothetical protein Halru_0579 [Halovivax ruber XH-70]